MFVLELHTRTSLEKLKGENLEEKMQKKSEQV